MVLSVEETVRSNVSALADEHKSLNAFDKFCGLYHGTTRRIIKGQALPSVKNLEKIRRATGCNMQWLFTGIGPKYVDGMTEGAIRGERMMAAETGLQMLELAVRRLRRAIESEECAREYNDTTAAVVPLHQGEAESV